MDKKIMLRLVSLQSDGEDKSKVELLSEGLLRMTDAGYEISYNETDATGFAGSTTKLTVVSDSKVTMERTGAASSTLILEKGKKHHCHYGTPYGDLMVGVTTNSIKSTITENGGTLDFKYVLDINSSYVGDYEINLDVKADS